MAAIPGIKDVGLTTNGILLAPLARRSGTRACGGSTSASTRWTRTGSATDPPPGFEQVIEGILAAKAAGFDPVKVNAVAIKGVTEDDVVPLGKFAREHGLEMRFIEYMPLDAGSGSGRRSCSPPRFSTSSPRDRPA